MHPAQKNKNLNDMAISDEMFKYLKNNLKFGKTILEFGSGTGTIELTKHWKVFSVEQNKEWIGKAPKSTYIHAPINHEDRWYDKKIVFDNIPKKYDLILVDGPMNSQYRDGICQFWDKLDTSVPIIFDDTHYGPDREVALRAAKDLNKEWVEIDGWQKKFIVLKKGYMEKIDNHVICMPFNLQYEGKPSMYEGNPSWLRNRIDIFKKYCLNSFNNQTDSAYHLFLYCDSETPSKYKKELLEIEKSSNVITIIWDLSKFNWKYSKEEKEGLKKSILKNYKKVRKNNSEEIICSRFENDDIPDLRYVEFVKQCHEHYNIISLGKGIYWDINTNQFLDSTFPTGPFISVKSTLDNFISPLEDEHHNYITKRSGFPVITEEPLWVQVIHGENVWNRMDRMPGKLFNPEVENFKQCFALDFKIN